MSRKLKFLIVTSLIVIVVLYLEVFSYHLRTLSWAKLPKHYTDGKICEPFRILIVGDPQIQGENDEPPFLGVVARWDADRYLQRTYSIAKSHVQPHAIIFMGDLFDEGSKAHDAQYRRYLTRFRGAFDLPRKNDPSSITYIFLPGDNDVGGEGLEEVSDIRLKWFNRTFGDFKKPKSVNFRGSDLQFVQYHDILMEYSKNPTNWFESIGIEKTPQFRIMLSHMSVLSFMSESLQTVVDLLSPSMILSAHNHRSNYFRRDRGTRNSVHLSSQKNFLLPKKPESSDFQDSDVAQGDLDPTFLLFNLNKVPNDGTLHEINAPTCSYRMGVYDMGFGHLQIYPDGAAAYTVLWSPSRFYQLAIYILMYVLMKIAGSIWFTHRVGKRLYCRCHNYCPCRHKLYHSV